VTRLQDESTRGRRALVFAQDAAVTGALPAHLRARDIQVELHPAGDELPPLPDDTWLVVVDTTADLDRGLESLRRLRPDPRRPSVLFGAIVAPRHRAAAAAAGADWLLDPAPAADDIDPMLPVIERRATAANTARSELEALAESHANLQALIENTDDFILFSDEQGYPLIFNTAYATVMRQLLGIEVRVGLKPHELMPDPDARAEWDGYHRRVLSGERFVAEYSHPLEGGDEVHLEVSYNPVRSTDGTVIGFSEFTRDVTARRAAEQELREAHDLLEIKVAARTSELEQANEALRVSEQRYRSVYETAPMALVMWDRQCRVLSWNRHAERLFGWTEAEVLGKPFFDFLIPEDAVTNVEQAVEGLLRGDGPMQNVNANVAKDGRRLETEWHTAILRDRLGEATGFLSLGLDITERVQMEERLRQAVKMEAVGQLAGGVAHDFNNQLVAMMGYADLVRRAAPDAETREHASRILQATRRSADLVSKLLTFARRARHETKPVDLSALVSDVVDLLRHSIDRRIVVQHRTTPSPLVTLGDAALLHSALLNLGLNARDAMPGGGTLSFELEPRTLSKADCRQFTGELAPGRYAAITVSDTGSGIEPDDLEHIFEPFFTTKSDGTGMGLAAVYGALRSHNGAVDVQSEPGRGTVFSLLLPRADLAPEAGHDSMPEMRSAERARILVVDDETLIRELLLNVLGDLGHEVAAFGDGRRALEHYRDHWAEIDLAILDVVMPEIDGIALMQQLQQVNPEIRVLISSGFSLDDRLAELDEGSVLGLLQKPYTVGEVERSVREALATGH